MAPCPTQAEKIADDPPGASASQDSDAENASRQKKRHKKVHQPGMLEFPNTDATTQTAGSPDRQQAWPCPPGPSSIPDARPPTNDQTQHAVFSEPDVLATALAAALQRGDGQQPGKKHKEKHQEQHQPTADGNPSTTAQASTLYSSNSTINNNNAAAMPGLTVPTLSLVPTLSFVNVMDKKVENASDPQLQAQAQAQAQAQQAMWMAAAASAGGQVMLDPSLAYLQLQQLLYQVQACM
jgi:hypothetical protein